MSSLEPTTGGPGADARRALLSGALFGLPFLALALLLSAACLGPREEAAPEARTVVFLLRHAEQSYPPPEAAPRNPRLNEAGAARAEQLAHVLQDAGITRIFSTEYHRSWDTAVPLAERLGLEIEPYDPEKLAAFAERLRGMPGRFVVSGHSNTTPELVGHLGGDPGAPIDHTVEFDRLYVVTLETGRPVSTLLLHYGEPPMTSGL